MNDTRIGIYLVSAFMAVVSSAAFAAEEMLPSEYYKTTILPKASGVYEYQENVFVHSKAVYESKKPSAKNKALTQATYETGTLLRRWAIDLTAPERTAKESLTAQERRIKQLLDGVDGYWQFPDWNINTALQCVMDGREGNEYVVGLVGEKALLVSQIPAAYRMPCTSERLKKVLPIVAQRKMKGTGAEGFMKMCGAWDLVKSDGVAQDKIADYKGVNDEIGQYVQSSPLVKTMAEEIAALSVPQVVTNRTSVMNAQGTALTEKIEIVKVTRFPRMQRLFLNCLAETNYPTARLPSGTAAIAGVQNPKATVDEQEKLIRAALCDSPGDKELWNYFGRVLMSKNDNLGAIICFRNALKLDARFVYPIVNLARAYKALGRNSLSLGTAVVGRGLATDAWSIRELDKIFWEGTADPSKEPELTPPPPSAQLKPKANLGPSPATEPSRGFSASEVNTELDF